MKMFLAIDWDRTLYNVAGTIWVLLAILIFYITYKKFLKGVRGKKRGIVTKSSNIKTMELQNIKILGLFDIHFDTIRKAEITLNLLSNEKNLITTIFEGELEPKLHKVTLDTTQYKNGMYFIQWVTSDQKITKRVIIDN